MSIFSSETQELVSGINNPLSAQDITLDFLDQGESEFDINAGQILTQFVQGYIGGFSTMPVGEMSNNRIEQIARQTGHLAGFIGFGLSPFLRKGAGVGARYLASKGFAQSASAVANFRSLPMLAADLTVGKLSKSTVFNTTRSAITRDTLVGRQMFNEGLHLGIASGISAWSDGFKAMGVSTMHGAFFGGAFASVASLPVLRERDTIGNVLRTLSGSIVNVAPSYFQGADAIELGYQALLGAYFGYRQPTAEVARAQEFIFKDMAGDGVPPTKEYIKGAAGIEKYNALPEKVKVEVDRFLELTHPEKTEGILHHITKMFSENAGMPNADKIVAPNRPETASDRIREQIMLQAEFDTGNLPGARLVNFANEMVTGFGEASGFQRFNTTQYARWVGTFGMESRRNGTDFNAFAARLKDANESAFKFKIPDSAIEALRPYHASITQDHNIPTFGLEEGSLSSFNDTQRNFDGKRIETKSPLKLIHMIAQREGLVDPNNPTDAAFVVIQGRENRKSIEGYDLDSKSVMDMDKIVGARGFIDIGGKQFKLKDEKGNHLFYPISGEADKSHIWYARYNLPKEEGGVEAEWSRISRAWEDAGLGNLNEHLDTLVSNWHSQTYPGETIQERPMVEIISGGQTGAGQGALQGAKRAGLGTGGLAPKDFMTEIGSNDDLHRSFGLGQSDTRNYNTSNRANAEAADGTVVFGNLSAGSGRSSLKIAEQLEKQFGKPAIHISDLSNIQAASGKLSEWLLKNNIKKLNVAGDTESANEGLQYNVDQTIYSTAQQLAQMRVAPSVETARETQKRMFISNVRYQEAAQSNVPQDAASRQQMLSNMLTQGDFLGDVTSYNKRLQPLFNSYYRLPSSIQEGGFSYAIISDISEQIGLDRSDPNYKDLGAITDGAVIVRPSVLEKIHNQIGMNTDGSSAKPFIISPDSQLGLLIGKTAFHKADAETSAYMENSGLDFMIYESSAKQRGLRQKHQFRVGENGEGQWKDANGEWSNQAPQFYRMDASHVHVDFAKGDKSVNKSNRVLAQLMNSLTMEQLSYVASENGIPLPEGRYAAPEMANTRFRNYMSSLVDRSIRGTSEANAELESWITNRGGESLDRLFTGSDPMIDTVDKIRLYNSMFQRGNEELRSRVLEHIMKDQDTLLDFEESMVLRSSEDVNDKLSDIEYVQSKRRGAAATIIEASTDKASSAMSKQARNYVESLFGHWLVQGVTRPLVKQSANMIMKPYSHGVGTRFTYDGNWMYGEGRKSFGDLNERTYIMEDGLKDQIIDVPSPDGPNVRMTLGEAWKVVSADNVPEAYRDRVIRSMSVVAARVPMGDISGAQFLRPIGFSGTKGNGVILHHKTMKRLGGADLDIDNAFVYWNLPEPVREVIEANKYSSDTFREGRVEEFLRDPVGLPGVARDANPGLKKAAMFDSFHRIRIGSEVAKGRGGLAGVAVNSKQFVHALYSYANANGEITETLKNGTEITWVPRQDNGELLRSRADGAITASVDVGTYGAMADRASLKALILNGAFKEVRFRKSDGTEGYLWRDDVEFGTMSNRHLIVNEDVLQKLEEIKNQDSYMDRMSIANAGIRGKAGNRLLTMQERIDNFKRYPREIPSYVGTVSEHFRNMEIPGHNMIDYVYSSRNSWEQRISSYAEFMNQDAAKEWYPFLGDGPKFPYTAFHQFLRAVEPNYKDKKFNLFTTTGRENIAADINAFNELVNRVERGVTADRGDKFRMTFTGKGLRREDAEGARMRYAALTKWQKKIEDFMSNDLEQVSSLPIMRKYFLESRLRKEEATELTRIASYLKGIFSKAYTGATEQKKQGLAVDVDDVMSSSPRAYALDEMERMYNGFLSGSLKQGGSTDMSTIMRVGLPKLVETWNQSPSRLQGTEARLDVDAVHRFLDSVLISPYSLKEGGTEIRTLAQSAGFEVASADVIRNWTESFSEIFKDSHVRPSKKSVRELLTQTVAGQEQSVSDAGLEWVNVNWSENAAKKLDADSMSLAKEIYELASHYKVFRDYNMEGWSENNVIYVMRSLYGKADPKDFSMSELEGFRNTLLEWRNGYGFMTWLQRGGFKTLRDAQAMAKADGKEFKWWHTLQFAKTTSDYTKVDDIMLIDRSRSGATAVPLKTFINNPDGSVSTIVKTGRVLAPEPHFEMLRRINGENLNMLSENLKNNILQDQREHLAFADAGVIDVATRENHIDELFSIAVHEMQLDGFSRMLEKPLSKRLFGQAKTGQTKEARMAKYARRKYMEKLGMEQDPKDPNKNFRAAMNRMVQISTENGQVSMTAREAINFMKQKTLYLTEMHDKYVSAKGYAEKNIKPFLIDGEINIKMLRSRLSDMIDSGQATDRTGGHLSYDASKLLNVENDIAKLATLKLRNGEKMPNDADQVARLEFFGSEEIKSTLDTVFGSRPVVRNMQEAMALKARVEQIIKDTPENDSVRQDLEIFSKYLSAPLADNDMRRDWQGIESYSQFQHDMEIASGNISKISYLKKKIRDAAPLHSTDKLEGFFPHVQFDMRRLEADAIANIEMEYPSMSAEERQAHIGRINESYLRMRRINNGDDGDAVLDAAADYALTGDTEAFLRNASGVSSGKQSESFASAFGRGIYWDGYLTDIGAIRKYGEQMSRATYKNLSSMLSRNVVDSFEASGAMGVHNKTWANWMRLYIRDVMGKPTTFPEGMMNDPNMKLKSTPYYWLSDHNAIIKGGVLNKAFVKVNGLHKVSNVEKAFYKQSNGGKEMPYSIIKSTEAERMRELTAVNKNETVTKQQAELFGNAYRGFSDVEAKYEMMSLLFHAKSYMNNIFGGSVNTIAYTGLKPFLRAQKLDEWKAINPEKFRTFDDVLEWVSSQGVIEDFVLHEAAVTGRFRKGKWKDFLDDAAKEIGASKGKLKDVRLYEIAKSHGITEKAVDAGASFMRSSERFLRTRTFLAGYLQARDSMSPMDIPFDHPHLIDQGRKAVAASQFLYGSAERPPFARTSFGKVYSRFKLWGWSSIKLRREVYQEAKRMGWEIGGVEFERLKRFVFADMFMVSLASMFPFSMFENTLPPPFSWMQDLSDYFFGDEYDQKKAFFGSPLGPASELMPVLFSRPIKFGTEAFNALVSNEPDTKALATLAQMFPFGRMGYDTLRAFRDPQYAQEYLVGIPLRQFAELKEAASNNQLIQAIGPIIQQNAQNGMTTAEMTSMLIEAGIPESQTSKALSEARKRGMVTRSMQSYDGKRGYIWKRTGQTMGLMPGDEFGSDSFRRGF